MMKITKRQLRNLADEYGESYEYLHDVAAEASAEGERVDEAYMRDFSEEMYDTDDIAELIMAR